MIALLGKIDRGFEPGDQIEERRVDLTDRVGQRALQLIERGARLERRHRVDQVGDRFGLRQIDPAVQKCAKRELAGLREPRAAAPSPPRRSPAQDDGTAVRAQLDDVLAGVGVRGGKEGRDHLIDRSADDASLTRVGVARASSGCSARDRACARMRLRPPAPLRRTTPMPPRPGGVAMATMVSVVENTDS